MKSPQTTFLTLITLALLSTVSYASSTTNSCQLQSDFTPSTRAVYDCKSSQSINVYQLMQKYCNVKGNSQQGVADSEFTVNHDLYSMFCKNGASFSVTCLNGSLSSHYSEKNGKQTLNSITCHNNQ